MLYRYGYVKEYGCRTGEALRLLRRVVTCRATMRELSVDPARGSTLWLYVVTGVEITCA